MKVVIPMKIRNKKLWRVYSSVMVLLLLCAGMGVDRLYLNLPYCFYNNKYEEFTVDNQIDVIFPIGDSTIWMAQSESNKIKILNTILCIEENYLGLSNVSLIIDDLPQNKGGYYNKKRRTIYLNRYYLDDNQQILKSLLHEVRHSYQVRMCELYIKLSPADRALYAFYDTRAYIDEYQGRYISPEENHTMYLKQESEIDAYRYSREAVEEYMSRINGYIYSK
ncbi:MAG: hypothetical protein PUB19_01695 [Lachnospiraceae bacterium]|nr:hypothetical protein [Lachnospiraceae bacterium]